MLDAKHFRDNGSPEDELPLVEWSCRTLLYQAQEQLHGLLRNFPNRPVATLLPALSEAPEVWADLEEVDRRLAGRYHGVS